MERIAEVRLLDADVLRASCDGDAEILSRVIAGLRAQLPKELAEARARLDACDATGLRERAHRLHGMVSTVSVVVAAVASELEDEAASGRFTTSAALLARLEAMTAALLTTLAELSVEDLLNSQG